MLLKRQEHEKSCVSSFLDAGVNAEKGSVLNGSGFRLPFILWSGVYSYSMVHAVLLHSLRTCAASYSVCLVPDQTSPYLPVSALYV